VIQEYGHTGLIKRIFREGRDPFKGALIEEVRKGFDEGKNNEGD